MSDPEYWTTKVPNTVQVKYTGQFGENMQDVTDWVEPLFSEGFQKVVYPMGNVGFFDDQQNQMLAFEANQYVYLDEDGLHVASKGAFELMYKKDPPA